MIVIGVILLVIFTSAPPFDSPDNLPARYIQDKICHLLLIGRLDRHTFYTFSLNNENNLRLLDFTPMVLREQEGNCSYIGTRVYGRIRNE